MLPSSQSLHFSSPALEYVPLEHWIHNDFDGSGIVPDGHHLEFPETEHVHFYGFYIGNFPDLSDEEVDALCTILNSV